MASFFDNKIHAIQPEIIADMRLLVKFALWDSMKESDEYSAGERVSEYLDKYEKAESDENEKSDIIGNLTHAQEEILKIAHAADYHGTDDDMPDAYEAWIENLTLEELKSFLGL